MRWGQVNLKEDDPLSLEVDFWVDYWKRTRLQGITLNAGGGVAYYPTKIPLHRRARFLGDRDLFGELVAAAKQIGLRVLARLDPNFAHEEMYQAHPDWFLTDAQGKPRQRGQAAPMATEPQYLSAPRDVLYSTCWNSPFHRQFMLEVMTEIMQNYEVDGFFTNGWPPIGGGPPDLSMVCYCPHCRKRWNIRGHQELPTKTDPSDPLWRDFVSFVQESVEEVQSLWRQHTKELRPSATFVWNSHGSLATGLRWDRFHQLADLLNDDAQGRAVGTPLWDAGRSGKVMMAVAEGKPVLRVFGTWHVGNPPMRHTAKPLEEEILFVAEAVANGQRPWWHHLGGTPYDRRWMKGIEDYYRWLAEEEPYFRNTTSLAEVGLLWSPRTLWLERWAREKFQGPSPTEAMLGWYLALLESRIPFDLVPEWKLQPHHLSQYHLLLLPSMTCLDEEGIAGLANYVANGGGLVSAFEASLRDSWGRQRADYGLASLLGVHRVEDPPPALRHCYLQIGKEERRHPLFKGMGDTDILPGSAWLSRVEPLKETQTLTTFIPTYPTAPPEKVYRDPAETHLPLIFLKENPGRCVYFAMDLDAAYWRSRLPDHRRLMINALQWVRGSKEPSVLVEGPGLLDVTCWRQEKSLTVHLVNLNTPNLYGGNVTEIVPVGEQKARIKLPKGTRARSVRLLRTQRTLKLKEGEKGVLEVLIPQVRDYEVLAIDLESA